MDFFRRRNRGSPCFTTDTVKKTLEKKVHVITCWSCDSHVTSVVVIATGEFRIDTTRSNIGVPLRTMTVSDNTCTTKTNLVSFKNVV